MLQGLAGVKARLMPRPKRLTAPARHPADRAAEIILTPMPSFAG